MDINILLSQIKIIKYRRKNGKRKRGYFFLDDSFDGLNEKIEKEYIRELKKESYEELLEDAKREGIENPELYNKKELIEKFKELSGLDD